MRLLPLLLFSFAVQSQADILFLDVNNAGFSTSNCATEKTEICSAVRAAEARGEKLIIIPRGVSASVRQQVSSLSNRIESNKSQREKMNCRSNPSSSNCKALEESYGTMMDARSALTKDFVLNKDTLKAEMGRLARENAKISTVVVSGHDGEGQIDGEFGNIQNKDIENAFSSVPGLTNGIHSVYLWGCYTTSMGNMDGHWMKVFPSSVVFAGFDGKGPLKVDPNSYEYLEKILGVDKDLIQAKSEGDIRKVLEKVPHFGRRESAICVGNLLAKPVKGADGKMRIEIEDLSEARKCRFDPKTAELYKVYQCYTAAVPGSTIPYNGQTLNCENPPSNTSPGQPLRDFWKKVVDLTAECETYWKRTEYDVPHPNALRGVLFYKNVQDNVRQLHKNELKKIDDDLAKLGFPKELRVSDLTGLKRSEVIARLAKMDSYLKNVPPGPERDYVRNELNAVSGVLSGLHEIPADWHGASPTKSEILLNVTSEKGRFGSDIDSERARIRKMLQPIEDKVMSGGSKASEIASLEKKLDQHMQRQEFEQYKVVQKQIRNLKDSASESGGKDRLVSEAKKLRDSQGTLSPSQQAAWKLQIEALEAR